MGIFGGDSSSTNKKTAIGNDGRVATQSGTGISLNFGSVAKGKVGDISITATDHGAVNKALTSNEKILTKAINAVTKADAVNGQGYTKLLQTTEDIFKGLTNTFKQSSNATLESIASLSTAKTDASGALDQKTILVLAAAVVAGLWAMKKG